MLQAVKCFVFMFYVVRMPLETDTSYTDCGSQEKFEIIFLLLIEREDKKNLQMMLDGLLFYPGGGGQNDLTVEQYKTLFLYRKLLENMETKCFLTIP